MTATSPASTSMQAVLPRLWASAPQPLSFAPSTVVRAFVLERPAGNVLVYSAGTLGAHRDGLAALGGVARHYLGHWHEARVAGAPVDAPLFVHAADAAETRRTHHVRATFSARHRFEDDLEVIPIPGHTPGATAYLWDSGEHRLLFTGDSLYLDGDEWVAAVLSSSDRQAYVRSLELIRELDFDVLVPWAASADGAFHAVTSRAQARRRLDAVIDRVRRGANR